MPERVVLMPWWWVNPWKQVRILAGNLDACRWAAERFSAWKQPPGQWDVLDIGPLAGEHQQTALLMALGRANPVQARYTQVTSGERTIAWIVPP